MRSWSLWLACLTGVDDVVETDGLLGPFSAQSIASSDEGCFVDLLGFVITGSWGMTGILISFCFVSSSIASMTISSESFWPSNCLNCNPFLPPWTSAAILKGHDKLNMMRICVRHVSKQIQRCNFTHWVLLTTCWIINCLLFWFCWSWSICDWFIKCDSCKCLIDAVRKHVHWWHHFSEQGCVRLCCSRVHSDDRATSQLMHSKCSACLELLQQPLRRWGRCWRRFGAHRQ